MVVKGSVARTGGAVSLGNVISEPARNQQWSDPYELRAAIETFRVKRQATRRQRPPTGTVGNGAGGSQRLASSGLLAIVLDGGEDCLR